MTPNRRNRCTRNWAVSDARRDMPGTDTTGQRHPAAADVYHLVANGACLYFPPSVMSIPIPIVDVRIHEFDEEGEKGALFVWATIQTPFGSRKPLFGLVSYSTLERLPYGIALGGTDGARLRIIVDVRALAVPDYTRDKLIKKAQEHAHRLKVDEPYRRRWDQYFDGGVDDCVNAGQ